MDEITPVVLCGGVGERLWPLSRKQLPKQFVPLIGGENLFATTLKRSVHGNFSNPLIVTNADYGFLVEQQLKALKLNGQILLEPEAKNTAAAVIASAYIISQKSEGSLILVMPSDHHIPDKDSFVEMVSAGCAAAKEGFVVVFGVTPDSPATGFGYLKIDKSSEKKCFDVLEFSEKPNQENAAKYLASGQYLWNAGIFLFEASTILSLAKRHVPELIDLIEKCIDPTLDKNNCYKVDAGIWGKINSQSIDYAILEKTEKIKCVRFEGNWSDLGNWNGVFQLHEKDTFGNTFVGNATLLESTNSSVYSRSNKTHFVGFGLENLVAIVTDDAVLVADSSRTDEIKKVTTILETENLNQLHENLIDFRPWGSFERLDSAPGYQVKRLKVSAHSALSLQSHKMRSEHWIVVSGVATVTLEDRELELRENHSFYIEAGQRHRLTNNTDEELVVIEVQLGSYLGEDDIVRYEDVYNRPLNAADLRV